MTYTTHAREMEAVRQNVAWQTIRDAYAGAYKGVFGRSVDTGSLAILLAHSALETGRWKKGLWNWNLGNIKASPSYIAATDHYHQYYRLNEYLKQSDGKYRYVWFDPPHPQTRMRAYQTSAEGAAEKVRFLGTASNPAKGNRYARAWQALEDDDPVAFSRELHAAGYYTAQEAPYTRGVVSLTKEFLADLEREPYLPVEFQSKPLDPHEYDHGMPLHSAANDMDINKAWDGEIPWLVGIDDDLRADIEADKRKAILEMDDDA